MYGFIVYTNQHGGNVRAPRVCSYDRAGYGWSEPGPMPRAIPRMARELKALLDASGEKGPYVMAAVSLGGPIVRVYTGLYPDDVVGLILVDASHEDKQQRVLRVQPPELIEQNNKEVASYERWERIRRPFMLYLGIERFLVHFTPQFEQMPQVFWEEYLYLSQQRKFQDAMVSEIRSFPESSAAVHAAGNLRDRPLIVLTASKMTFTPEPFLTTEIEDKIRNVWIELQAEQAHLSTRGKQIIVPESTHLMMFERPDAVVAAIREVWSEVREGR